MPTAAIHGYGFKLQRGDSTDGASVNFTDVLELISIKPPKLAAAMKEVTHFLSPGAYPEFIDAMRSGGVVEAVVNWQPQSASHGLAGLLGDFIARPQPRRDYRVQIPPATGYTQWSFSALVADFEPVVGLDGQMTAKISLQITGQPTLA
jgi:hypothetical protein